MGPVLGLDTGSPIACLGLVAHGRVLAEATRPADSHCASLPDTVGRLLQSGGVAIGDLAGVAVGIGPGSFTGLRIALSYAKGLVAASGCVIAGVPSLDAIALCALDSGAAETGALVCPILDARKGEVYAALYRVMPDGLEKLSDDLVVTLESLIQRISGKAVLAGDRRAVEAGKSLIEAQGGQATVLTDSALASAGRFVAALGAARFARGEADHPVTLEPLYVRPPEASVRAVGTNRIKVDTEGIWSSEKSSSFRCTRLTIRS